MALRTLSTDSEMVRSAKLPSLSPWPKKSNIKIDSPDSFNFSSRALFVLLSLLDKKPWQEIVMSGSRLEVGLDKRPQILIPSLLGKNNFLFMSCFTMLIIKRIEHLYDSPNPEKDSVGRCELFPFK